MKSLCDFLETAMNWKKKQACLLLRWCKLTCRGLLGELCRRLLKTASPVSSHFRITMTSGKYGNTSHFIGKALMGKAKFFFCRGIPTASVTLLRAANTGWQLCKPILKNMTE